MKPWVRMVRRLVTKHNLTPARIAGIYFLFGVTGVYLTDIVLTQVFTPRVMTQLETVKAAGEVVVTTVFIYGLTRVAHSQLRRTNKKLCRQREELDVLHRVLRHNLRNDLTVVSGTADYLATTAENVEVQKRCTSITGKVAEIDSYIDKTQTIQAITAEGNEHETFNLSILVDKCISTHEHVTEDVHVTTDLPESLEVTANTMFPAALHELITNAIVHNDTDHPEITIRATASSERMTALEIIDNGPGIPETVQDILVSGEYDQLVHLNGLGLWTVSWVTQTSGGRFIIDTMAAEGTTVRIELPTVEPPTDMITSVRQADTAIASVEE